ncbi:hypothetical protein ACJX0J_010919 [Zea mays]
MCQNKFGVRLNRMNSLSHVISAPISLLRTGLAVPDVILRSEVNALYCFSHVSSLFETDAKYLREIFWDENKPWGKILWELSIPLHEWLAASGVLVLQHEVHNLLSGFTDGTMIVGDFWKKAQLSGDECVVALTDQCQMPEEMTDEVWDFVEIPAALLNKMKHEFKLTKEISWMEERRPEETASEARVLQAMGGGGGGGGIEILHEGHSFLS